MAPIGNALRQRTILLTGASGVVGRALLPVLKGGRVICLTHDTGVGTEQVRGDIAARNLGLPEDVYHWLAGNVTTIIHAAARTDFAYPGPEQTNVEGTRHVVELTRRSGAHLIHVSTAFVNAPAGAAKSARRYAESKRVMEELVWNSGVQATVVRPSIVVGGDSATGMPSRYRAMYDWAEAVLGGYLHVLPLDPSWYFDVVPQDLVAACIAGLTDGHRIGQTIWISCGTRAPTLAAISKLLTELATACGRIVHQPRFVEPAACHRAAAPVFPSLPTASFVRCTRLLDEITEFAQFDALPSSVTDLLGPHRTSLRDPIAMLAQRMAIWARSHGYALSSARPMMDGSEPVKLLGRDLTEPVVITEAASPG